MSENFVVHKNGNSRVDIEIRGRINGDDMRAGLDALTEASKDITHGQMLYRITDFQLPSLDALGIELSRFPALFSLIRKFDRVAVLADQWWIKKAGELEGLLIPGMDIKTFNLDETEQAEAWLSEQ